MTPLVLTELTAAGVSLWLDDLSRGRLSGDLQRLVQERAISGVTTNPTIFETAIAGGSDDYAAQVRELRASGADIDSAIRTLTTDDVRAACDILAPVFASTGGRDGRVSIEVDPRLAHNTEATIEQARELWTLVDRPNAMIKIPATTAGLPAITNTLAAGISVNVTLIFSIDRYREVMDAHTAGIRHARDAGLDVAAIESVASFLSAVWTPPWMHGLRTVPHPVPSPFAAAPLSPTPTSRGTPTKSTPPRMRGVNSQQRVPARNARCGPVPASRTRTTTQPDTWWNSPRPDASIRSPSRLLRRWWPKHNSPATRSPVARKPPNRFSKTWPKSESTSRR